MQNDHTATDPTTPALDLTADFPTSGPDAADPRPRRGRRLAVAAVALALVSAGVAVAVSSGGSSSTPQAGSAPTATSSPAGGVSADLTSTDAPQSGQPGAEPQAEPEAEPESSADPGVLVVSTDEINLPDGWYTGSFQVRNTGDSPLTWHWQAGGYGISVSQSSGTLEPGEAVVVSFNINPFQLQEGDFLYDNAIFDDQVSLDLRITGHRTPIVVNPNIPQGPPNLKP